jgi:hypothetical protein
MDRSIPIVTEKFAEGLDYTEWREHLKVHRKGGGKAATRGGAPAATAHHRDLRRTSASRAGQDMPA